MLTTIETRANWLSATFRLVFLALSLTALLHNAGFSQAQLAGREPETVKKAKERRAIQPNIVLIVADDLGYGDMSCYGATKVLTPQIDKLAADGVRFTDAYVVSSLCSPSRYSILTGRYSWRTRLKKEVLKSFAPPLIEEGRTTLASMLKRKGYFTACVGKWHLGFDWALKENAPPDAEKSVFDTWGIEPQQYIDFSKPVKAGPVERGFDYFFGIPGSNNMIPFVFIENDNVLTAPTVPNDYGTRTLKAPEWDLRSLDQTMGRKAVEVIHRHFAKNDDSPLFLYLATSAIHAPCLPSATKGLSQAGLRGDMVLEFDRTVGEVVKALERNGALDNTLVIVTSDNGPLPGDAYSVVEGFRNKAFGNEYDYYQSYFGEYRAAYPGAFGQKNGWIAYDHDPTGGLLGFKSDAWEGGLRVPFIVYWPKMIKKPAVSNHVISTVDLLATLAEVTGEELGDDEGEDSYSFLQTLRNRKASETRKTLTMVGGRSGALVIRKGDWKYIEAADVPERLPQSTYPPPPNQYPGFASVSEQQLYNLKDDLYEKRNLADKMPEKVMELQAAMEHVKATFKTEGK